MKRLCTALIVGSLLLVGCSSDNTNKTTTTTKKSQSQGKVSFKPCGTFECATISVPMDYKKPKERQIELALIKKSAADPAKRIGVLLVNPGGPGASGVDFVKESTDFLFPDEILDRFDIIGWDPRGVGQSTRVDCAESLDPLFDGVDYSPDSDQELTQLKAANAWIGEQCKKADKELLPHLSTHSSVLDMDSIRKQLGEDQINYLGFSYGTALGQLYAHQFPKNFRTMVIDGVIDLESEPTQIAIDQALGFEGALNSFFEYCRTNVCSFARGQDPAVAYSAIAQKIDATPMPSIQDPTFKLGPAQLDIGTSYSLYSGTTGWETLDTALTSILSDNPDLMLSGFSSYVGRSSTGKYDGSYASFLSIGCADGNIGNANDLVDLAQSISSKAPLFGESGIYLGLPCTTWPGVKKAKALDVDASASAPIVVIGTSGDPATPVQWARKAAKDLKTGVYIELRGEGHTSYGQGSGCINDIVDTYFLTAKEPSSQVCT